MLAGSAWRDKVLQKAGQLVVLFLPFQLRDSWYRYRDVCPLMRTRGRYRLAML